MSWIFLCLSSFAQHLFVRFIHIVCVAVSSTSTLSLLYSNLVYNYTVLYLFLSALSLVYNLLKGYHISPEFSKLETN